jgi:hypothetical protein
MGWTTKGSEFEFRWLQEFSLFHVIQTESGAHPTAHPMGTGALPVGVKRPGREAEHSLPTTAEVKKTWLVCIHSPIRRHGIVLN